MKKLSLLCLAAAMALLGGCTRGGKTNKVLDASNLPLVKVEQVHMQEVEQTYSYSGAVTAFATNMIASQTMRIDKILVEVGDPVKAGQLLVQMEEHNYLQAKLQYENLKVDYSRAQSLLTSGGIAQQQVDQLKTQLDVAKESLENLERNTYLRSPLHGTVTQRNFENGDMTGGQPILVVQQLNPLKVVMNVSENLFPLVKQGMHVNVGVDIYPGRDFAGKIHLIHPTIDPVSHTFTVEVEVNNTQLEIRPGFFARVSMDLGVQQHVVVSDKAVVKQYGTNDRYVYVLHEDQTVSYQKVLLGQRKGNAFEVLEGLQDNQTVVTAGQSRLVHGAKVQVVEE